MAFSEMVEKLAAKANLKVMTKTESYVQCLFGYEDGRTQMVHLMPAGDLAGHPVVRISTPVVDLPAGELPASVADGLLKENGTFKIGAFQILENEGKRILVFGHNMILDRLEADEMALVVAVLAHTGDQWEKKLGAGSDRF